MKRIILVVLVLLSTLLPVSALDATLVTEDLGTLLGGFGSDILGALQQTALLGDGIGDAELGDFPHMSFSLSAGAALSNGIGKIAVDPSAFKLLNIPAILQTALTALGGTAVTDLYNGSLSFFPYPNARLALGVGTVGGFEVIGQVSVIPQALTDWVGSLVSLSGLTLNQLNAGVRVRKVLLGDAGGFPAVSLGAGYVYSSFNLGYSLATVGIVNVSGVDFDFSSTALSVQTLLHTAGIDLTVSKRLLVFVPFLRISSWYQWGSYDGKLSNFKATLGPDTVTVNPQAQISVNDLSILFSGGLGIKLGPMGLTLGASYNPRTNFPAAELVTSLQF